MIAITGGEKREGGGENLIGFELLLSEASVMGSLGPAMLPSCHGGASCFGVMFIKHSAYDALGGFEKVN